jgi:hypothetical protein
VVGAPGAGANCTAALSQLRPEAIPVDEDAALVEDTVQKKGCGYLYPVEESDIQPPSGHALKTWVEIRPVGISSAGYEQVQIGIRVLVAARHRAVEDGQPNPALGAKRATETGYELPVIAKVVVLPRIQTQPARAEAAGAKGPLRRRSTQRALAGIQVTRQLLESSHRRHHRSICVRYKTEHGSVIYRPRYPCLMRPRNSD